MITNRHIVTALFVLLIVNISGSLFVFDKVESANGRELVLGDSITGNAVGFSCSESSRCVTDKPMIKTVRYGLDVSTFDEPIIGNYFDFGTLVPGTSRIIELDLINIKNRVFNVTVMIDESDAEILSVSENSFILPNGRKTIRVMANIPEEFDYKNLDGAISFYLE